MLIKGLLRISLFILFCVSPLAAQSSLPQQNIIKPAPKQERTITSGSQSHTRQHQEGTNNQQQAADKPIIIVQENKTKIKENTTQTSHNYDAQYMEIQRQLSEATQTIAYFTIGLVFATIFLAGIAIWQGTQLKRSVNSLIVAEKAHVFAIVEPDREFDMWKIDIGDKEFSEFSALLYLHNLGKTPAIIKEIAYAGGKFQNPPTIEELSDPHYPLVSFVGSNQKVHEDQFQFFINKSDLNTIRTTKPTITFYCYGYIKYKTIFSEDRCHGFCFELHPPFGKFALSPNSEMNYDT